MTIAASVVSARLLLLSQANDPASHLPIFTFLDKERMHIPFFHKQSPFQTSSMTVYAYDVDPNVPIAPPVNFASSPPMIILYDLFLILRNIATLPLVFTPWPLFGIDASIGGLILQVVAFVVSLVISGVLLASLGLGVPAPWIAMGLAWIGLTGIKLAQGKTIIPPRRTNRKFAAEAWFA